MAPFDLDPSHAVSWIWENPGKAALYGAAGAGASVALAPALVSTPALAVLGFGADGIAKASLAAGIQSGIGNVVAPSLFATLQSAGMAGYGAAVVNGAVSAGGGTLALASGVTALMAKSRSDSDTPETPNLNPIEYVWAISQEPVCRPSDSLPETHTSLDQIREMMGRFWDSIPVDTASNFDEMRQKLDSMVRGKL
ncbi:hypothetical protein GGR52DRAFT_48688 [Hypoxylon sp. FL1284]|nr:hypothetical protein GGR52DRAFT_48688 [Hypoxylon sp. FL1284]